MYAAVPETIGQSGRNQATARDGNNITSTVTSHTGNPRAKSATSKPASRTARSAAR
jgi:hypothetical protein